MLAQSKAIATASKFLVDKVRVSLTDHLEKAIEPLRLEWCVVFDNSGSMVRIQNECAEALVAVVETLRKLECRFAVGTLGAANKGRLLKELDEPFSAKVGERCLAGFTYDESTSIASCVKAFTETVIGGAPEPFTRRAMLVITDGLSSEMEEANFDFVTKTQKQSTNSVHFAVLHTPPRSEKADLEEKIKRVLDNVTNGLNSKVRSWLFCTT